MSHSKIGVVVDTKETPFRLGEPVIVNYQLNTITSLIDERKKIDYKSNVALVVNS